jgi:hypothetical protein
MRGSCFNVDAMPVVGKAVFAPVERILKSRSDDDGSRNGLLFNAEQGFYHGLHLMAYEPSKMLTISALWKFNQALPLYSKAVVLCVA